MHRMLQSWSDTDTWNSLGMRATASQDTILDGAFVYWHDTSKGALMRVARSGGRVETFASTSTPYSAVALAMGASSVYVLRSGQLTQDGSIAAIDKTSGATRTVIDGLGAIGGAVVAGRHLYWSNPNQGTIQRVADR